jgi:membrane protein implicated in regulation of membrane protease activity
MPVQWLVNWWNLIFVLPFSLALLYLGLYTVSGITFGDADADGDFDADGDIDHDFDAGVDHDLDADADADADGDVDQDLDADQDVDGDHDAGSHEAEGGGRGVDAPVHIAAMNWLGIGRVPVSLVLMVLLLTWGVAGFLTNAAMQERGAMAAVFSIPIAAVVSFFVTHTVTALIARYLPLYETTAQRRHALLGSVGEAMYPIDRKFGMVSVREETGDLYQVACRAVGDAIGKGSKVKLVSYNAKEGLFYVAPHDAAESGSGVPQLGRK